MKPGEYFLESGDITANGQDLAQVTEGDRHRVNALVLLAIFAGLGTTVRHMFS